MKRFHFILILAFSAAAAILLWQGGRIHDQETSLRRKLAAAAPLAASPTSQPNDAAVAAGIKNGTRPDRGKSNDDRFIAGLKDALAAPVPRSGSKMISVLHYISEHPELYMAATPATFKTISEMIAATGINGENGEVWVFFLGSAARTHPEWAIAHLDEVLTHQDSPNATHRILKEIGKHGSLGMKNLTPEYILTVEKWLATADSSGRLKGMDKEVAALRFDMSVATADLAGATRYFAQLPADDQAKAAGDLAKSANTPEERRQLLEQAGASATPLAFRNLVQTVAHKSGFEASRDLLTGAKLTPENHDLAAASIAGAQIGPETPARAAWLLESLKSENKEAVTHFASAWTEGDYAGTAGWLKTLPEGDTRDAAVAGFAPVAARIDGATAADWALALTNPTQREATLDAVYQTWKSGEPEAAAAYYKEKGIKTK